MGKMLGLIVFAIGVVLLVLGFIASDSIGDQLSKAFTGEFTESTTWYFIGGILCMIIGGGVALFGRSASE